MNSGLENKLIECLEHLERGESIERILSRFPEQAELLRPHLETAVKLAEFKLNPSLAAQQESRAAFLDRARNLRVASRAPRFPLLRLQRLVAPAVALVMIVTLGFGLISLSAEAVPGEPLYGTKRLVEDVQLALVTDPASATELAERLRQERIREIRRLLDEGRDADVEFEGIIQRIASATWVIAGLDTIIEENTRIRGVPRVGDLARVMARTKGGNLVGISIDIEPTGTPEIAITPTPSPSPTPPPSSTPTATPETTAPQSPTGTITPTATASPSNTPTVSPTPPPPTQPTPTSIPADNANDDDGGGDDNSNDNEANENDNEHGGGEDDGNENESSGNSGSGSSDDGRDGNENEEAESENEGD